MSRPVNRPDDDACRRADQDLHLERAQTPGGATIQSYAGQPVTWRSSRTSMTPLGLTRRPTARMAASDR